MRSVVPPKYTACFIRQQGITVYLLNFKGDVLQVLTPKQSRNARLSYLQFKASESDLALAIVTELIRQKTQSQIATLEKHPELESQSHALEILEEGLHLLHTVEDINRLRQLEGILATSYFGCFHGVEIKWERTAKKVIPEEWLEISPRNSPISSNGDAKHAVNPYHAALNFALALLKAQVLQAINIAMLEPTVGFLHSYEQNKDSLVFDIMEPFRAQVDHLVLSFFQKTTFRKGDFIQALSGEARMNEELRRYILASCRVSDREIDKLCRRLRNTLENS